MWLLAVENNTRLFGIAAVISSLGILMLPFLTPIAKRWAIFLERKMHKLLKRVKQLEKKVRDCELRDETNQRTIRMMDLRIRVLEKEGAASPPGSSSQSSP